MKASVNITEGFGAVQVEAPPFRARALGPLITNTDIPGERKSDGITPAHPGGGALRVAEDRWIIFFATLNPQGSDCNKSILYQLRSDTPDGPILREGVIDRGVDDWDPFETGDRYVKSCGMPIAFGVPKGATHLGSPMPNANVFVVKWYRWAHLRRARRILHPSHNRDLWPDGLSIKHRTLRVEWMQFRLNSSNDDIVPLTESSTMRQAGYESGDVFCSLGPDLQMNHAMKAPVPETPDHFSWVSCDTFTPYALGHVDHGEIAPVRYTFDRSTGLYQWVDTGRRVSMPDRVIGEACVNRTNSWYVISLRCFEYNGRSSETIWFKTRDLFGDWGEPSYTATPSVPRMSFVCGDGVLRLFCNLPHPAESTRDDPSRAVLGCRDLDVDTMKVGPPRLLIDGRAMGLLPFRDPVLDMAKICPPQGRRQLLLYRAIDRSYTANTESPPTPDSDAFALAGIHALELSFPEPTRAEWTFA